MKFEGIFWKLGSWAASLALLVAVYNVNTACVWIGHQPELPEQAQRLRKF